ncbi:MAG: multidrug DMT transporter permease [Porphyromonadaceae bacterium CG2_30_38_12]|nr:MAG: multidrug DMT transporter permease [Porphyromonadaceae bacterium CG2_30_38_12]
MFLVSSYSLAVIFTIITMLCWGSWANTQKLAGKTWRFELFYWDYVIGILLLSLVFAFTLGSNGDEGRPFLKDIAQADVGAMFSAFVGGVIFNLANILVVAAIAITGMAVAFPVGIGLALVLGVVLNYIYKPEGDPLYLFTGVALVALAIVLDAMAYKKMASKENKIPLKGILLAITGGILMALFYRFVAGSMANSFSQPEVGKLTPYTAVFIFSVGVLVSNFLFNTILMKRPFEGSPVNYRQYFKGKLPIHLVGVLGGIIWCIGMSFSIIASGQAGFAISYGLGQGATLVAAIWGVFVWREFKGAPKGVNLLLAFMFLAFIAGLSLIILSKLI